MNWIFEVIGLLAGISILVSFIFKNILINKPVRMFGCVLFIVYGILVPSVSVMFIGAGILVLDICTFVLHFVKESEETKEIERRKKPSINGEFGAIQDLVNRKYIN